MRKSRFTTEQIIGFIKQAEAGIEKVSETFFRRTLARRSGTNDHGKTIREDSYVFCWRQAN